MHLQTIEIANFSCLRDVKLDLTPLHALIGPNDSGKSTILRAVRTLTQCLALAFRSEDDSLGGEGAGLAMGAKLKGDFAGLAFEVEAAKEGHLTVQAGHHGRRSDRTVVSSGLGLKGAMASWTAMDGIALDATALSRSKMPARLLRLDADTLRSESDLIPESELVTFLEWDGKGMRGARLPGIYDAIMNRGDDAFTTISKQTEGLFPTVRNVRLRTVSNSRKLLEVELTDGTHVPAAQVSEGLLYFLAYAALPCLAPSSILLVEEPENGLHPTRIRDVMDILKKISKTTQVVIATHSPLVVNELEADQVTVVTRDPARGTQTRRLNATPDFEVRSKVYLPGELWLNYANGVDEADLLSPKKAAT